MLQEAARRCGSLFVVSLGCSESREGVARWRVRRTVGSFGVVSGYSSLHQEVTRGRVRRPLVTSQEAARRRVFSLEGYTSSYQARYRVQRHLVISCACSSSRCQGFSSPLESLSEQQRTLVVPSSEGYSPLPQQRAHRRRLSRGLLVAAAESSSGQQSVPRHLTRELLAAASKSL